MCRYCGCQNRPQWNSQRKFDTFHPCAISCGCYAGQMYMIRSGHNLRALPFGSLPASYANANPFRVCYHLIEFDWVTVMRIDVVFVPSSPAVARVLFRRGLSRTPRSLSSPSLECSFSREPVSAKRNTNSVVSVKGSVKSHRKPFRAVARCFKSGLFICPDCHQPE